MKRMFPHLVYAGLLVADVIGTSIWQPLRSLDALAQGGCRTFPETGRTVCGKFLQYWDSHGGLAQQGYPIGPEIAEKSELNGQTYTVQYFERAVFELHPENKAPYDVLLSQLGTYQAQRRYGNPPTWPGALSPTPMPTPPPGVNSKVQILDGVFLIFKSVSNHNYVGCGSTLEWEFNVQNTRDQPVSLLLDASSVVVVDSTGASYKPIVDCKPGTGAFEQPNTVPAKSETGATIRVGLETFPPNATYADLRFVISGATLTFRYPLR